MFKFLLINHTKSFLLLGNSSLLGLLNLVTRWIIFLKMSKLLTLTIHLIINFDPSKSCIIFLPANFIQWIWSLSLFFLKFINVFIQFKIKDIQIIIVIEERIWLIWVMIVNLLLIFLFLVITNDLATRSWSENSLIAIPQISNEGVFNWLNILFFVILNAGHDFFLNVRHYCKKNKYLWDKIC